MIFNKREEKLLEAFIDVGRLSISDIEKILGVSQRTVYRILSELEVSLQNLNIQLQKSDKKYGLVGDISQLSGLYTLEEYSRSERLMLITQELLENDHPLTNAYFQESYNVSNVTIIQDINDIEKRLSSFELGLDRSQGYQVVLTNAQRRYLLAVLLTNRWSSYDFHHQKFGHISEDLSQAILVAQKAFRMNQSIIPDMDARLSQFFIILLALSNRFGPIQTTEPISKRAIELAQKVFLTYSQATERVYNSAEILYWAHQLDTYFIKRQENPLYVENFDGTFYYSVANLIDKISSFTKINFVKDKTLFKFLFNHLRLSLAVPSLFMEYSETSVAHVVAYKNEFLHRLIRLVVKDLFPAYIQTESEFELITLHFASSIRRSPDIYPITVLLLSDQRPLSVELLVTRIKSIAPFVQSIQIKRPEDYQASEKDNYDFVLSTTPMEQEGIDVISGFPSNVEILKLQEKLQKVQVERNVKRNQSVQLVGKTDLQAFLEASQDILERFYLKNIDNPNTFEETVAFLIHDLKHISDSPYLINKLLERFRISPFAIPETGLALLHTQSHTVEKSQFVVYELANPIRVSSMNHGVETVSRILVMLTKIDSKQEVKRLMSAIGQSIIENHLYTEIYKTGNQEIIYQLLNTIFTQAIKELES